MLSGRSILTAGKKLQILTVYGSKRSTVRQLFLACQHCAKQKVETDDGPIPFSSSKAASWSLAKNVLSPERDIPWYQPMSISISLTIFLAYFFFLREENDLDLELNHSLFERLPHLEEQQIRIAIDYNRMHGKDTRELEERYAEIQRNKAVEAQSKKAAERNSS